MADGYRNYGPDVSESPQPVTSGGAFSGGAFSGDGRSYESLVVQADAPVIDWEMNLRGQIGADYGLRQAAQRWMTSCWLGGDFLERSDPSGSIIPSTTDGFHLPADNVLINGWNLRLEFTQTSTAGLNIVSIPDPPSTGSRTDLVILEVWRALIKAAPDGANKSATGMILRNGNVYAPDAVNLSDDLIDPNYGEESNARVQIQYRLRTITDVDLASYPDGITDPTVVANTVSNFSGPGADGSPTVYTYSVSSDDKGLWVAGLGNSVSAGVLGTVDGYMYAQPVFAWYRRNSTAFDRSSNMNGAGVSDSGGGPSDRPDGLYNVTPAAADIVDLRRMCSSSFEDILEQAFQEVLDNTMSTQGSVSDLGTTGTSFLYRDDIGNLGHAGDPDGVRRYFSDRGITDTVVALNAVGGLPQTNVVFMLSSLRLPWNAAATNVLANAPSGTNISFLSKLRIRTSTNHDYDMFDQTAPVHATKVVYSTTVAGVDTVTVTLNTPVSNANVYAQLSVEYPPSFGVTRNVVRAWQLWAATAGVPAWMDVSSWVATSDPSRKSIPDDDDGSQQWMDPAHREQAIRHRTTSQSAVLYVTQSPSEIVGADTLNSVDTSSHFTLKIRTSTLSAFTSVVVTAGVTTTKATIKANLNSQFAFYGLALTADVVGNNEISIVSSTGYLEVDSVAGGSTLNTAVGFSAAGETSGASVVMLPERLTGDPVTIDDGTHTYSSSDYTSNTAYTTIELNFPLASGAAVTVTYTAYRPAPIIVAGHAYNSFYQSNGAQSLLPPAGTQTLRLVPRSVGKTMSVIAVGPGSPDSSFPFTAPGDQIAVGALPAPDFPESLLDGPADVQLQNFGVNTGYMTLPPFVPYSPSPGAVTLYRDAADVVTDADGRNFWPRSDSGSTPAYSPVAFAQEIAYGRRHKTAYPVLMELKDDVASIGQKGMLVLVVFSDWSNYSPDNKITLTPVPGTSAAAVYRVRGNAMNPRRPNY